MKECPFCQELNRNDEIQCRYCGEWLDEVPVPRKKKKKEKKSTDDQLILQSVGKKYAILVILSVIIVIAVVFYVKQTSDVHIEMKQEMKVVSPLDKTPAAVPVQEVKTPVVPPSNPADDLIKKAQALCSPGLKCPQEAIDYLTEAIGLEPDNRSAYLMRGGAYYNLGKYKLAVEDYNNAIRLGPEDAHTYAVRGFCYGNMGQYEPAVADFNEAIRLKPDRASYYRGRGHIYIYANKMDEACVSFAKACELGDCEQYQKYKQQGRCK
jgi:tetratricopeptide (TPR) repeat protein